MTEATIVRENLMTKPYYTPYCGNVHCKSMPRTLFLNGQFGCPACGWRSEFPSDFIERYKAKWSK